MLYTVLFDVRTPGRINHMIYHCLAKNANEAKQSAREYWYSLYLGSNKGRARNLYAKKTEQQDTAALRVTGWEGTIYTGTYVLGRVFCTGSTNTWKKEARA